MAEIFSLRALQAFEAAARLGSFALAAEELGNSPAAVSQLIRGLEDQTGRRLFDRARRGIQLNEAGREALPRLSAAFQDIRETSQILRHRIAPSRLVISVPPSVATGWLPGELADFLPWNPMSALGFVRTMAHLIWKPNRSIYACPTEHSQMSSLELSRKSQKVLWLCAQRRILTNTIPTRIMSFFREVV